MNHIFSSTKCLVDEREQAELLERRTVHLQVPKVRLTDVYDRVNTQESRGRAVYSTPTVASLRGRVSYKVQAMVKYWLSLGALTHISLFVLGISCVLAIVVSRFGGFL